MTKTNDKKCSRCGRVLSIDNFGVCNSSVSKKQSYCKNCSREYSRLKRIGNPPEEKELSLAAELLATKKENEILKELLVKQWSQNEKVWSADVR